jgi:DNA-binding NarL/FixJ family response regulator
VDIEHLKSGGSPLSPVIARQVLKRMQSRAVHEPTSLAARPDPEAALTAREIEILNAISRGFSYHETAGLLAISVQTVHTNLKRSYRTRAGQSKTEAGCEADKRGLL